MNSKLQRLTLNRRHGVIGNSCHIFHAKISDLINCVLLEKTGRTRFCARFRKIQQQPIISIFLLFIFKNRNIWNSITEMYAHS